MFIHVYVCIRVYVHIFTYMHVFTSGMDCPRVGYEDLKEAAAIDLTAKVLSYFYCICINFYI
jgi:hypothetical protein